MLGQSPQNEKIIPLQAAIESFENSTDYIFNYDPVLLNGFMCDGNVEPSDSIHLFLDQLFYDSPFSYELNDQTVIVFMPKPTYYRICGTLLDELSQEPLVAANISVLDTTIGSQTDLLGFFDFEYFGFKNQEIEIRYLGYQPIRFSVQDLKDKGCPSWDMKIDQNLLGSEIIIRDYLIEGISIGEVYGGFSLDFDQLSKSHSNIEHDLLKTAQLLPGINSIDDSATNLQVRGSNPGQNLVLWEGAPLYNAGHVFGMISAINPFSVEQVNIYKGAYHPKYDNRVGGILDISLADDLATRFHGSVGSTLTELHGNLTIPVIKEKLTIEIAGRHSINEFLNSPTLQSYTDKVFQFSTIDEQKDLADTEGFTADQSLSFSDWNAKLLYRPTEKLKINAGIYRNTQDFNYSFLNKEINYLTEDLINLNTQIISFDSEYKLTNKWTSKLSFYQSSYENNYDKMASENSTEIIRNDQLNQIMERSITWSNNFSTGENSNLNIGYENNAKEVILDLGDDLDFDPEFVPIEKENASFHNLFQAYNYNKNRLQIDAGNRSSYYQDAKKWFHSPRINVQYGITKNLKVKADGGIYHQFISQLTNVGADQIKVDNPLWILNSSSRSLSQKANKIAAGIIYKKDQWLVDLDFYQSNISNISTVGPQFGIISELSGFSEGNSKVLGMDFLLKKSWSSGINTWLSYTLGSTRYTFPEFGGVTFAAPNDIRHNLNLAGSYTRRSFQMSFNAKYHSGLPYTLSRLALNEEDPDAEPPFLYLLDYDLPNQERLDFYLRMDINISYSFNVKPVQDSKIEISCSLLNIFNRTNFVAREYYLDYDDSTDIYKASYIQKALLNRTALLLFRFHW